MYIKYEHFFLYYYFHFCCCCFHFRLIMIIMNEYNNVFFNRIKETQMCMHTLLTHNFVYAFLEIYDNDLIIQHSLLYSLIYLFRFYLEPYFSAYTKKMWWKNYNIIIIVLFNYSRLGLYSILLWLLALWDPPM
jgi:hypothetical protein